MCKPCARAWRRREAELDVEAGGGEGMKRDVVAVGVVVLADSRS